MLRTALTFAALACLTGTAAAEDLVSVHRYAVHLADDRPGNAESFGRFLSVPRSGADMELDMRTLGVSPDLGDVGVLATTTGATSVARFNGGGAEYVRDRGPDGRPVRDVARSGDVLTLDRKGDDRFAYHLSTSWVTGFDGHVYTAADGTTWRVQRPRQDDADLSGTVDPPVDRAMAIVEPGPETASSRDVVIFVVRRTSPCDRACSGAKADELKDFPWSVRKP